MLNRLNALCFVLPIAFIFFDTIKITGEKMRDWSLNCPLIPRIVVDICRYGLLNT